MKTLRAVLVGLCVAGAAWGLGNVSFDKYYSTVTATATLPGVSAAMPPGSVLSVQCNVATYVRPCKNALNPSYLQADGGRANGDGGYVLRPDAGYVDFATANDVLVPANALVDVPLGSQENCVSTLSVSGTSTCHVNQRGVR